jgi:hypothetical protein
VDLVSAFELLGYAHGNPQPTRLLLAVPVHGTVQADGGITVGIEDLKLLPSPSG